MVKVTRVLAKQTCFGIRRSFNVLSLASAREQWGNQVRQHAKSTRSSMQNLRAQNKRMKAEVKDERLKWVIV